MVLCQDKQLNNVVSPIKIQEEETDEKNRQRAKL
jgi:hypothetical protein